MERIMNKRLDRVSVWVYNYIESRRNNGKDKREIRMPRMLVEGYYYKSEPVKILSEVWA
jgi:hypothetical protein